MKWAGQQRARYERDVQLRMAREAMQSFRERGDPIYIDIARVHIRTARSFHRNAWRGVPRAQQQHRET